MVDRIRQLMDHKGYTSTQFADTVEVPRAVISHIISGRNKPSLDVVIKIVSAFPDVSKEWVLLGEGDMLKHLAIDVAQTPSAEPVAETPEIAPGNEQAPLQQQEKVQKKADAPVPFVAPEQTGKAIEQIVIFYTDKTFTVYRP